MTFRDLCEHATADEIMYVCMHVLEYVHKSNKNTRDTYICTLATFLAGVFRHQDAKPVKKRIFCVYTSGPMGNRFVQISTGLNR
jgi:hypothetical protein